MNKLIKNTLAIMLFIFLVSCGGSGNGASEDSGLNKLTVSNQNQYSIFNVYISPSNTDSWGNDWLCSDCIITQGEEKIFTINDCDKSYDIRIVYSDDSFSNNYNNYFACGATSRYIANEGSPAVDTTTGGNTTNTQYNYVCNNGTVSSGQTSNPNTTKCSSCNSGYSLSNQNTCYSTPNSNTGNTSGPSSYSYVCANGTASLGSSSSQNTTNCVSCNSGYSLSNNACVSSIPSVTFTLTDDCAKPGALQVKFFGYLSGQNTSSFVWPSANQVYTTNNNTSTGSQISKTLSYGNSISKICYGAGLQNANNYWGVGLDADYGCTGCCYGRPSQGGNTKLRTVNLTCSSAKELVAEKLPKTN